MPLFVVHVAVHVKPDAVDAFRAATLVNARASLQEPGIARFDVMQQADDATRFLLIEIYRASDEQAAHRETEHYKAWSDTLGEMMASPRVAVKYTSLIPEVL